jgi:hypothetical protein
VSAGNAACGLALAICHASAKPQAAIGLELFSLVFFAPLVPPRHIRDLFPKLPACASCLAAIRHSLRIFSLLADLAWMIHSRKVAKLVDTLVAVEFLY